MTEVIDIVVNLLELVAWLIEVVSADRAMRQMSDRQ